MELIIDNINMFYHNLNTEIKTLENISFSVKENDFVSIVGPSGCGKSTLLHIISGLVAPSSGTIKMLNEDINKNTFGYMFQKDHLFDWLNVWENITLGLKIQKNENKNHELLAKKLLEKYDLLKFKDMYPKELSGGMRQRVALIRTLVLNPRILLLDEPFSALDYQTRLNISDEVYNIIKNENKTIIMVTHDIAEAISLSNKIIILSKRPAVVKNILSIEFLAKYDSPLKKRSASNFKDYFDTIWKELNISE